jgi:hypothetical protein
MAILELPLIAERAAATVIEFVAIREPWIRLAARYGRTVGTRLGKRVA